MVHLRSVSLAVLAATAISGVAGLPAKVAREDTSSSSASSVESSASAAPTQMQTIEDAFRAIAEGAKLHAETRRKLKGPHGKVRARQTEDKPHYLVNVDLSGDGTPEPAQGDLLDINTKRGGLLSGDEFGSFGNTGSHKVKVEDETTSEDGSMDNIEDFAVPAQTFFHNPTGRRSASPGPGPAFLRKSRTNKARSSENENDDILFDLDDRDEKVQVKGDEGVQDTRIYADNEDVKNGKPMLVSAASAQGEDEGVTVIGGHKRASKADFDGAPGYIDVTSPVFNSTATKLASLVLSTSNGTAANSSFVLNASSTIRTQVFLVPISNSTSSTAPKLSSNGKDPKKPLKVNLKVPVFVAESAQVEPYCATFDPSPATPAPLSVTPCGENDGHTSQVFLFEPATGVIRPDWEDSSPLKGAFGAAAAPSSVGSFSSMASSMTSSITSASAVTSSAPASSISSSSHAGFGAAGVGSSAKASSTVTKTMTYTSYTPARTSSAPASFSDSSSSSASGSASSSHFAVFGAASSASASSSGVASGSASSTSTIPDLPLLSSIAPSVTSLAGSAPSSISSKAAGTPSSLAFAPAAFGSSSPSAAPSSSVAPSKSSAMPLPSASAQASNVTLIFSPANASVDTEKGTTKESPQGDDGAPLPVPSAAAPLKDVAGGAKDSLDTIDEIATSGTASTASYGQDGMASDDDNEDDNNNDNGDSSNDDQDDGSKPTDDDGSDNQDAGDVDGSDGSDDSNLDARDYEVDCGDYDDNEDQSPSDDLDDSDNQDSNEDDSAPVKRSQMTFMAPKDYTAPYQWKWTAASKSS